MPSNRKELRKQRRGGGGAAGQFPVWPGLPQGPDLPPVARFHLCTIRGLSSGVEPSRLLTGAEAGRQGPGEPLLHLRAWETEGPPPSGGVHLHRPLHPACLSLPFSST